MKKLYFLAVVLIMFAGCKKGETAPVNPLVGKWQITQQLAVYYVNGAEVYRTTLAGVGANSYTEFKADGTLTDYALGTGNTYTTTSGTYSLTNTTLHIAPTGGTASDYVYTAIDNNNFTLSISATGGGTTSYVKNGQVYTANGQTVTISFIRL